MEGERLVEENHKIGSNQCTLLKILKFNFRNQFFKLFVKGNLTLVKRTVSRDFFKIMLRSLMLNVYFFLYGLVIFKILNKVLINIWQIHF